MSLTANFGELRRNMQTLAHDYYGVKIFDADCESWYPLGDAHLRVLGEMISSNGLNRWANGFDSASRPWTPGDREATKDTIKKLDPKSLVCVFDGLPFELENDEDDWNRGQVGLLHQNQGVLAKIIKVVKRAQISGLRRAIRCTIPPSFVQLISLSIACEKLTRIQTKWPSLLAFATCCSPSTWTRFTCLFWIRWIGWIGNAPLWQQTFFWPYTRTD